MISESPLRFAYLRGLFFEYNAEIGQIASLRDLRKDRFWMGTIYDLLYVPSTVVTVLKNTVQAAVIKGLPFKQALFGIWQSADPVQNSLKEELLGYKKMDRSGMR